MVSKTFFLSSFYAQRQKRVFFSLVLETVFYCLLFSFRNYKGAEELKFAISTATPSLLLKVTSLVFLGLPHSDKNQILRVYPVHLDFSGFFSHGPKKNICSTFISQLTDTLPLISSKVMESGDITLFHLWHVF